MTRTILSSLAVAAVMAVAANAPASAQAHVAISLGDGRTVEAGSNKGTSAAKKSQAKKQKVGSSYFVPVQSPTMTQTKKKGPLLNAGASAKKQQLKSPTKTSKAIKTMPDAFISSFQRGGSSNRGKGTPPPPPPKDDCMSCAD